jgi:hypothetical protein
MDLTHTRNLLESQGYSSTSPWVRRRWALQESLFPRHPQGKGNDNPISLINII